MDPSIPHNKNPKIGGKVTVSKSFDTEALRQCLEKLMNYSQQRKELLDRVWQLEHDAEVIRQDITDILT